MEACQSHIHYPFDSSGADLKNTIGRMASRGLMPSVCCFMFGLAFLAASAAAADYELHWIVPPSADYYTNWTSNKTFEVGDSVMFNWTTTHNVADVSKSEYDNCTKTISVIASPVAIRLSSSGNRYFICTVDDHCGRGQKLAITIKNRGNDKSSASFVSAGALYAALPISLVYFLSYYYYL